MSVSDRLNPAATPTATPQPASAAQGIDRAGDERSTPGLIDTLRLAGDTVVLAITGDRAPLAAPDALHLVPPAAIPTDAHWAFLGRRDDGAAVLLAAIDDETPAPAGWGSLREVGGRLSPSEASLFVEALCIARWLRDAPFCPACGSATELTTAGWARRCLGCSREHFPRTDPAVIVAVTDGDRILLGSNAMWEAERYSCFAGFVEAGESLESCVRREVAEEAGVELASITYMSSQAWPYPRSLMLGFRAEVADAAAARPDGEEILQVRWFTRDEILAALDGGGTVTLPGTASIAHALITGWARDLP